MKAQQKKAGLTRVAQEAAGMISDPKGPCQSCLFRMRSASRYSIGMGSHLGPVRLQVCCLLFLHAPTAQRYEDREGARQKSKQAAARKAMQLRAADMQATVDKAEKRMLLELASKGKEYLCSDRLLYCLQKA